MLRGSKFNVTCLNRSRSHVTEFQSPGERLHATAGDVPPVLGMSGT